jgi:hypothetical protein
MPVLCSASREETSLAETWPITNSGRRSPYPSSDQVRSACRARGLSPRPIDLRTVEEGAIEADKEAEMISKAPLPLLKEFTWVTVDLLSDAEVRSPSLAWRTGGDEPRAAARGPAAVDGPLRRRR